MTYLSKYGVKSASGGGRSSARETVARVAAGAVAEKYLKENFNTEIVSWVSSVGEIQIPKEVLVELVNDQTLNKEKVDLRGSFRIYIEDCDFSDNDYKGNNSDFRNRILLYNKFLSR